MLDTRVKERLTGAIILVALLVLLVPELLTGPGRRAPEKAPADTDAAQMRSYTINLADGASVQAAPVTDPAVSEGSVTEPEGADVQPGDGTPESADAQLGGAGRSQRIDARPATAQASAGTSGPAVQAASAEGASSAAPTTRAERVRPSAQGESPAPTASASAPRPNASAARAEPPARTASAATPATTGWAIQVGSFASRENAERLARELKGKGFAATISQSSGGKQLWRVRVGPEADRAAAVTLGAKLRAAGQAGTVVPHP